MFLGIRCVGDQVTIVLCVDCQLDWCSARDYMVTDEEQAVLNKLVVLSHFYPVDRDLIDS